ncbi:MAG: hypothetical protein ACI4TD_00350, partial [Phocaeicola sp.]
HIINFTYNNKANKVYNGITNSNNGIIANSSISGFKLKNATSDAGVICHYNSGDIINCRIKSDFKQKPSGSRSSIICQFNYKNIYNVFIEDYEKGLYGLCSDNLNTGQYYNCIMPKLYESKIVGTDNVHSSSLEGVYLYEESSNEYQTAANTLNKWIEGEGKKQYPTLTFRRWTTDPTQKVIFE